MAANEPLVGSLAEHQPWLLLVGGFLASLLVTAFVEVLLRRRAYALALVDHQSGDHAGAKQEATLSLDLVGNYWPPPPSQQIDQHEQGSI